VICSEAEDQVVAAYRQQGDLPGCGSRADLRRYGQQLLGEPGDSCAVNSTVNQARRPG